LNVDLETLRYGEEGGAADEARQVEACPRIERRVTMRGEASSVGVGEDVVWTKAAKHAQSISH